MYFGYFHRKPVQCGPGTFLIPLTRGVVSIVDECDVDTVAKHTWCAWQSKTGQSFYCQARINGRVEYMHRLIMQHDGYIDHANGCGVDNRRSNLRIATNSQNNHNKVVVVGECRFKGVRRDKKAFVARIMVNGVDIRLGNHKTEGWAAKVYDVFCELLVGEFSVCNHSMGLVEKTSESERERIIRDGVAQLQKRQPEVFGVFPQLRAALATFGDFARCNFAEVPA